MFNCSQCCLLSPQTALHYACVCGHPEVVTLLIQKKCCINFCDSNSSTVLVKSCHTVQFQEEECYMILLKSGADPNVVDARGSTALHFAVDHENTGTASDLLMDTAIIEAKKQGDIKLQMNESYKLKKIPLLSTWIGWMDTPLTRFKEEEPRVGERMVFFFFSPVVLG
ncbi:Hypothetical predicted protein [Marmota monax]|uniref:Uncharacterized protein n=1 Tax=Marmota monax TaxID=9995 RepID=A0A5E4CX65_MARMO|nr:hypothetical protein GHT09_015479 [Marmota monax]VTJ85900.1 Hypothetical predicted protein [Marmota monax]